MSVLRTVWKEIWSFLNFMVKPLKVIKFHLISFFLWISFTIFGGLIGVVISVIRNWCFGSYTLSQAIYVESMNGAFYTYSIAMVATVLSAVFIIFAEKETLNFRRYQIPFITLSIFLLFFGGVYYALSKQAGSLSVSRLPDSKNICIEWKQFTIFALSVIFSVYSFCVCRLDDHKADFENISDNRDRDRNATPRVPETTSNGING